MNIAIRSYATVDRPGLIEAIDLVCRESPYMTTCRFKPTPSWEHALDSPLCSCHLLLVAVDGRCLVGWCRLFPDTSGQSSNPVDLGIGLLPDYRGRGIGTRMVRWAQAWAMGHLIAQVTLTVHRDNIRALRFFQRNGFRVTTSDGLALFRMHWMAVDASSALPHSRLMVEEEK